MSSYGITAESAPDITTNRMFQTYGIGHCYNKMWFGEVANGIRARVIAWMPLPKPPKGE